MRRQSWWERAKQKAARKRRLQADQIKARRDAMAAEVRMRQHSPWSAAIDVMFVRLHETLQTWPDAWHVDPHGTGNNPHVWKEVAMGDMRCTCGEIFKRVTKYKLVWGELDP